MLKFGKYKNKPIKFFDSKEKTDYLFWLINSKYWGKVDKETKVIIKKFVNYG